jgi:NAD(P)-dependent dehydrogenase (short-subunit alcohol dehydrogenase family)
MTSWNRSPAHAPDATGLVFLHTKRIPIFPGLLAPLNFSFGYRAQLRTSMAVNRTGQPEEVAQLVSYLASKEAGFVTGESINSCQSPPA